MRDSQSQSPAAAAFDVNEQTLPWQDLVASVFRHRRGVIISLTVAAVASTIWGWTMPPTYKATAMLMVRDNRTRIAVSPDERSGSVMDHSSEEQINSLVALLTSPVLVQEILAAKEASKKQQAAQKQAEKAAEESLGIVSWILGLPNELYRTLHNVPEPSRLERTARALAAGIVVMPVHKSSVVELDYYSGSPEWSAHFANEVVNAGIAKYTRLYDTSLAQEFYRDQRALLAAGVDEAQAAANQFRDKIGSELLTLNRDQVRERMAQLEQDRSGTKTELAELRVRRDAPPGSIYSDASASDVSAGIIANPAVHAIKARLVELEIQRGELLSRYAPRSAMITDIDRQIQEARRLLRQEQANTIDIYRKDADARIDAAQARLEAIAQQLADYRDKLTQWEQIAPEWERLQNELDTRRAAYQTYLRKEEEARFTSALDESQIVNVTIVQPATPPHSPEASPMLKLIAIGAMLGLVFGVALALVKDWIDPSVKTTNQAERMTGIPVLGEIPL